MVNSGNPGFRLGLRVVIAAGAKLNVQLKVTVIVD
jgi:hypothetical protein